MRKLVTIRPVHEIIPIDGADRIELAKVDGWQCVVKKGDFTVGDLGLFFEIDSILPSGDPRWDFMEARKFRVKTMKFRGVLSQGLLMPTSILTNDEAEQLMLSPQQDIATLLGVEKYEVPVLCGAYGQQKGIFPTHLFPKTNQERIQNIPEVLSSTSIDQFEVTEKLDGTSCSIWFFVDEGLTTEDLTDPIQGRRIAEMCCRVASRNWEIKKEDDNAYTRALNSTNLLDKLIKLNRNIAIQGEIIGPQIQGNKYKLKVQQFYVFDIYDIDAAKYLSPKERQKLTKDLDLLHVPVISNLDTNMTLENLLTIAESNSRIGPMVEREGLVFKSYTDKNLRFKVISNKFLLNNS